MRTPEKIFTSKAYKFAHFTCHLQLL